MSDDELEKLASAMKNVSPSKAARKSGMKAAMAAFDAEFAQETVTIKESAEEEISTPDQGLTHAPRPTGQNTFTGRVQTLGRDTMSKLSEIFTFKPKTAMMMGSCAVALFATSLYVPNMTFEDMASVKAAPEAVTAEVGASEVKTAETGIVSDIEVAEAGSEIGVTKPSAVETSEPFTESISPAVPKTVTAEVGIVEVPAAMSLIETPIVEAPVTTGPIKPPETLSVEAPKTDLPSNVVVIERRVLKTPASTQERTIPSVTKMETRRRIKTPASTVERAIPAVTKQVTRRVETEDGTFETVSETVVVTPQSVEYLTVPSTYETYSEAVVVQEASTELVSIPPVYETVRETVRINADGSTDVLKSESSSPSVVKPADGITSVSDLLSSVRSDATEDKIDGSMEAGFRSKPASETMLGEIAVAGGSSESSHPTIRIGDTSPTPAPMLDEIVVTSTSKSSRRVRRAERRRDKKAAAVVAPSPPPPAVAMAEVDVAVAPTRTVERVIPAVTKTITRRVVKTPASTQERVVPAITKDVTVRVENGDGTFTDVTKTFVIQEASTELVTIPATFQTVSETVVVTPAAVEYIVVNADGTVVAPRKIKRPKPKPRPQSGLLTAGDYDDVLNPDLYKVYLDKMLQGQLKGKDLPYVDANERVSIRVVDTLGKPVPLADISLKTARGQKMFPLRTGADGMAYLYPNYDSLESGIKVKVSVKGARSVTTRLTRKLIKNGGDIVVDLKMESKPVQALDLLLTIDATGSMGDEMRYLQSELKAIIARVEQAHPGIDVHTGLIVYRDVGDKYVVREIPFTDDIEDFQKSLAEQNANGGGDKPEAMHSAMQAGLKMEWRKDALKVNLLVADAPPHDRYLDETWEAGLISRTKGIHIVPLAASGVDKTAEFVMRSMAQITGGRFLFLTDDSGIGNKHAKPTVDCYVVTRLDGLVTRVLSSLIKGERVEPEASDVIRSVGNYRAGTCAIDEQDIPASLQTVSYKYKQ